VLTAGIREHGRVSDDRLGTDSAAGPPPAPVTPGELRPTGRPNARLRQTVRDMVISLAVVLASIAVIMAITWRPTPDPVRVIDPTLALAQARAEADYPILYPSGLDAAWRPTSARWEITPASAPDAAWHVGFVTPDDAYAQLGQSATEDPSYVADQIGAAEPAGEWEGWIRYDSIDQRALVRVDSGVTVVVSGTAPWPTLQVLAERLSPTGEPPRSGTAPAG
jgi:Protein of unknown function (DUF4245)